MRQLSSDDYSSELERHYEYYQQRIMRRLVNLGHDKESAEDTCHDAFERALKLFARQDTPLPQTDYHLENWLRIIAERIAIDKYRRNKQIEFHPLPENEVYTQFDETLDDILWLQEELPRLPPKYQKCLTMQLYGYTEKEIAASSGISKSAVSMNVARAKAELRRKYLPVTVDLRFKEFLKSITWDCVYSMRIDSRLYSRCALYDTQGNIIAPGGNFEVLTLVCTQGHEHGAGMLCPKDLNAADQVKLNIEVSKH